MKNKILAKCTADKTQMRDRLERGAEYIEIYLRDTEPSSYSEVENMTRNIHESGLKALVIHSPMDRKYILESFGNEEANKRMHMVSNLAQNMFEQHRKEVIVVIHQELLYEQIESFGMSERIENFFKEMLEKYPNVKYAVENLTIINLEGEEFVARSSYFDGPVKMAKYLRERLGTERIGTVLDICHALNSVRILKMFEKYGHRSDICLEQYIEDYSDTMFLVHLSNAVNLGFGVNHGEDFEVNEDKILLHHILSKLSSVGYSGPITLEVNEENPLFARRYSTLKERIKIRVRDGVC